MLSAQKSGREDLLPARSHNEWFVLTDEIDKFSIGPSTLPANPASSLSVSAAGETDSSSAAGFVGGLFSETVFLKTWSVDYGFADVAGNENGDCTVPVWQCEPLRIQDNASVSATDQRQNR